MRTKLSAVAMVIAAVALMAALSLQSWAEEAITRSQADEIISELRQMRVLLERLNAAPSPELAQRTVSEAPAEQRVRVGVGSAPALGRDDAPLTIVEFTDYQCPFCQQFHLTAFQDVKRDYIDAGKLRYASRDLPLAMHSNAMSAAHAARCAGEQNKFWQMRDALIANANQLGPDQYSNIADDLKLEKAQFQRCIAEERYKTEIAKDMSEAQSASITGTPSFVLGRSAGDTVEGVLLVGALPYAAFDKTLKELLNSN